MHAGWVSLPAFSGSLPDASPYLLQVCNRVLYRSRKKWVKQGHGLLLSPSMQSMCLMYLPLLFLTGWPAWITVLGAWSRILTDACLVRPDFSRRSISLKACPIKAATQVRQTELLMLLRLCCCWALGMLQWPEQRNFFYSFDSRGALSPLPALSVEVKPYIIFTAWGMIFSKNVLSEDQDCSYSWDKYRLKVWEVYAEKEKCYRWGINKTILKPLVPK